MCGATAQIFYDGIGMHLGKAANRLAVTNLFDCAISSNGGKS